MTPLRIITSGPDQAYPQTQTAWQRERAGGRLFPMHDEHNRPWTVGRIAGDMFAMVVVFAAVLLPWWVL